MWRLVLVLAAAGSFSLAAQQTSSPSLDDSVLLHGVLRPATEPSQPLRGARVTIAHAGRPRGTVFSDHEGRFRIPAAAPGPYTLTVTKAGFALETLELAHGASPDPLEIRMRPGAALTGQVLSADGQPAISVAVRARLLPGASATSFASGGLREFSTESDDRGEFRIGSLPQGRYAVRVERAGCQTLQVGSASALVSCDLSPSRDAAVDAPAMVALEPGVEQSVTLVTTVAPTATVSPRRGSAVVAGTIRDVHGEPLEGITVQAWALRFWAGRPVVWPTRARFQRTDDRGRYRIHGLEPGAYYVVAMDEARAPANDASATNAAPTDLLRAAGGRSIEMQQLSHVFYPGRWSAADASVVQVDSGFDVSGIDIVFDPVPGATVHGRAVDAAGRPLPVPADLQLVPRVPPGTPALPARTARMPASGTFEFGNVPPGEYVVQARTRESVAGSPAVPSEFAAQPVSVWDRDVGPVLVRTSPGSAVSGRVVFEGDDEAFGPSFQLWVEGGDAAVSSPAVRVQIDRDGAFDVGGLSGPQRFVLRQPPSGWWLKTVMIDGVNAAAQAVFFGSGAQSRQDVRVVIARSAPALSGRAVDGRGSPAAGADVFVFPDDASRWEGWRHDVIRTRTGMDGDFAVDGLAPGDYWVAATVGAEDSIASGEWQTPAFLGRLVPGARRMALGEGQRAAVELRVLQVR